MLHFHVHSVSYKNSCDRLISVCAVLASTPVTTAISLHVLLSSFMCVWYVMNFHLFPVYLYHNVFMYTPGDPFTPSNVMRVVREMEDWWGERGLGFFLTIPQSKQDEIRQTFTDEMDQKKQLLLYWINTDPEAGWRRLIWTLDDMKETKLADSIRNNAEPLTGIDKYMETHDCT